MAVNTVVLCSRGRSCRPTRQFVVRIGQPLNLCILAFLMRKTIVAKSCDICTAIALEFGVYPLVKGGGVQPRNR